MLYRRAGNDFSPKCSVIAGAGNYWWDEEFQGGQRAAEKHLKRYKERYLRGRCNTDWAGGFTAKASGGTRDETKSDFGLLVQKTNVFRGPKKHYRKPNGCWMNLVADLSLKNLM